MHRFALDLDPVAYIRNLLDGVNPDPVHALVLAELGGAESIVCYFRDDHKTVSERDISVFRQVVKSYLNIRSNLTEETIRKLILLKPDMITFVAPGDTSTVTPRPLDLDMYEGQLDNHIAEARSNDILSSVLIAPEISQIKLAAKLGCDYVELDCSGLQNVTDMDGELEFLDKLSGLALAASKLGMGANVSGPIGYDNIREISSIAEVEDIIVGQPILTRAMSIGIEQAVRDMLTLI